MTTFQRMTSPFDTICPPELHRARTLLHVSAGLGLLGLLVVVGAGGFDPVSGVAGLVGIVLQIVLASKLAEGRNWARIVLTIFIALSLLLALVGTTSWDLLLSVGTVGVVIVLVGLVQIVLSVIVLLLMWREASSRYIAAQR